MQLRVVFILLATGLVHSGLSTYVCEEHPLRVRTFDDKGNEIGSQPIVYLNSSSECTAKTHISVPALAISGNDVPSSAPTSPLNQASALSDTPFPTGEVDTIIPDNDQQYGTAANTIVHFHLTGSAISPSRTSLQTTASLRPTESTSRMLFQPPPNTTQETGSSPSDILGILNTSGTSICNTPDRGNSTLPLENRISSTSHASSVSAKGELTTTPHISSIPDKDQTKPSPLPYPNTSKDEPLSNALAINTAFSSESLYTRSGQASGSTRFSINDERQNQTYSSPPAAGDYSQDISGTMPYSVSLEGLMSNSTSPLASRTTSSLQATVTTSSVSRTNTPTLPSATSSAASANLSLGASLSSSPSRLSEFSMTRSSIVVEHTLSSAMTVSVAPSSSSISYSVVTITNTIPAAVTLSYTRILTRTPSAVAAATSIALQPGPSDLEEVPSLSTIQLPVFSASSSASESPSAPGLNFGTARPIITDSSERRDSQLPAITASNFSFGTSSTSPTRAVSPLSTVSEASERFQNSSAPAVSAGETLDSTSTLSTTAISGQATGNDSRDEYASASPVSQPSGAMQEASAVAMSSSALPESSQLTVASGMESTIVIDATTATALSSEPSNLPQTATDRLNSSLTALDQGSATLAAVAESRSTTAYVLTRPLNISMGSEVTSAVQTAPTPYVGVPGNLPINSSTYTTIPVFNPNAVALAYGGGYYGIPLMQDSSTPATAAPSMGNGDGTNSGIAGFSTQQLSSESPAVAVPTIIFTASVIPTSLFMPGYSAPLPSSSSSLGSSAPGPDGSDSVFSIDGLSTTMPTEDTIATLTTSALEVSSAPFDCDTGSISAGLCPLVGNFSSPTAPVTPGAPPLFVQSDARRSLVLSLALAAWSFIFVMLI